MTEADLPPVPFDRLEGRGVDHWISELAVTTDAMRREELHRFLLASVPVEGGPSAMQRDVRLATMDDIRGRGLVVDTVGGSDTPVSVPGHDIPDIPLELIDLSGATIFSNQTALVGNDLLISEHIRHMWTNWFEVANFREPIGLMTLTDIDPARRTARLTLPSTPVKLPDDRVYFLLHTLIGVVSFGHFIFDVLGQLILLDKLKQRYGDRLTPVVANEIWGDFGHDGPFRWAGMPWLYERLIGSTGDVVRLEGQSSITVQRAYTTTRAVIFNQGISVAPLQYLYRRIQDAVQPTPGSVSPERIYISRRDVNWREVDNLDEVEAVLRDFGFTFIAAGELTPQEIFDIVHGAKVIAGIHGSNLIYSMYMKDPGTIIELEHVGKYWRVLLSCAAAIGHEVEFVPVVDGNDTDIEALRACLSKACAA